MAIYYQPDAYSTSAPKLMGRNAAGESFLHGYLTYGSQMETQWLQVSHPNHAQHYAEIAKQYGRNEPVKFFTNRNLADAEKAGLVYHPGPGIGAHALQRRLFGDDKWSLCGITHTTSSAGAMDSLAQLITAPVQPWDGLICTSSAVRDNVEKVLQAQADDLGRRLGATKLVLPQVPVIPLGVNTQSFEYTGDERVSSRASLNISPETVVVLYMGRLSFHAKAHPLAMYQALETAAKLTGKSVTLIECGWHANQEIKEAFAVAAKLGCPSVNVITLDGREKKNRDLAWSSADLFCSLSDNIQETFGIVPIEAMAAGLPVVVSDWDGYKDTVRDGVDGFRIPTIAPGPGLLGDLALRHALGIDTYDMYCGYSSSFVAVHSEKLAKAFIELFNSPELRLKMGSAGRARAQEVYDWKHIIGKYESFWSDLNERRLSAQRNFIGSSANANESVSAKKREVWPARLDPSLSFASYPTTALNYETLVKLTTGNVKEIETYLASLKSLAMVDYAKLVFPSDEEINQVLGAASETPKPASELLVNIDPARKPYVLRSLAWLAKLGILSFS